MKKPEFVMTLIVILTLGLFSVGIARQWPYGMQLLAFFGFVKWLVIAIYACAPIMVVGYALARKVLHLDPADAPIWSALLWWSLGWAVVIALGLVLLAGGWYYAWFWSVFALIINLLTLIRCVRQRWQPARTVWRALVSEFRLALIGPLTGFGRIWALLLLLLFFGGVLHALLPPNVTDELSYHLVLPQMWGLQHHWRMPVDNYHLLFPANVEMIWGYALAIGGLRIPRLITLVFAILTIGAMRQWVREQGYDAWICASSVCFFALTPVAAIMIAVNYVEWPLWLWIFLGWWASERYLATQRPAYIGITALTWGLSAGAKYTALPILAVLAGEWLWRIARQDAARRKILVPALALLVGLAVFAGPWLLRNFALTADPLYPLGQGLFASSVSPAAASAERNVSDLTNPEPVEGGWRWHQWLYYATVSRTIDYRMHPGWPLLHYVVLLFGWRSRRTRPWFAVVMLSGIFFAFTPAARIFFPLMGLTWLFLPQYLHSISQRRGLRLICSGLLLLLVVPSLAMTFHFWFMSYSRAAQDYLMGFVDGDAMLIKDDVKTPVMNWIRDNTPEDSRLWVWCEDDVFYFQRWARPSSPYDAPAFWRALAQSGPSALSREIEADLIDYIVLDTTKCAPPFDAISTETRRIAVEAEHRRQLAAWMAAHLRLLVRDQRFEVYEVLPPPAAGQANETPAP